VYTLQPGHRLKRVPGGFQRIDAAGHVLQDLPGARFRSELAAKPLAGWIALSSWMNQRRAAVRSFSARWQVPVAPRTDSGQTIFLFSAIADPSHEHLVQAVLQWGPPRVGAAGSWSVSSWYVEPAGIAIRTAPVAARPGEWLTSRISVQGKSPARRTYICELLGKPGTTLIVPETPELSWYALALEAYDVGHRSDYPNQRSLRFTSVGLQIAPPSPRIRWFPTTRSNAFGETMTMTESGGAAAATVDFGKTAPSPGAASRPAGGGRPPGTPPPARPRRTIVQMILGSGIVFVLSLVLLFVSAAAIEWYWPKETFKLYAGSLLAAEIALPALLAGIMAKGQLFGILIDDRNRMSLGRFQTLLWSLLILSSYFTMAIWNARVGGTLPKMPTDLWLLLGITNGSAVVGAFALNSKRRFTHAVVTSQSTGEEVPAEVAATKQSMLDIRDNPKDASWTDLFFGEEASNKDTVDISRLQQFTFTLILLFVFGGRVLDRLMGVGATQALDMPDLDPSAIELLGFSNAFYLAAKPAAKPPATPT
jgi:hypothetical protein